MAAKYKEPQRRPFGLAAATLVAMVTMAGGLLRQNSPSDIIYRTVVGSVVCGIVVSIIARMLSPVVAERDEYLPPDPENPFDF